MSIDRKLKFVLMRSAFYRGVGSNSIALELQRSWVPISLKPPEFFKSLAQSCEDNSIFRINVLLTFSWSVLLVTDSRSAPLRFALGTKIHGKTP